MTSLARLVVACALVAGLGAAPAAHAASDANPDLDRVAALARQGQWAASESLAAGVMARLAADPRVDSLQLADALARFADARWHRQSPGDSLAGNAIVRAIGIRARRGPTLDVRQAEMEMLASRFRRSTEDHEAAVSHAREAIRICKSLSPRVDSTEAEAHAVLGRAFYTMEQPARAIPEIEEALRLREKLSGSESAAYAAFLVELALSQSGVPDADGARASFSRAIRVLERDPVANARTLGTAYNNLAGLERSQGRLAEAVEMTRRGYELAKQTDGENSLSATRSKINLAYQLLLLDDAPGAVALLREAIPMFASKVGPAHSQVVRSRIAYANALTNAADTTAALAELDSVDVLFASKPGALANERAFALALRSNLLHGRGRNREAREAAQRALALTDPAGDPSGAKRADVLGAILESYAGPADAAALDSTLHTLAALESTTILRRTPSGLSVLSARARAEARVGRRDAAWSDALLAEGIARERFRLDVRTLPDRRALGQQEMLGNPLDLVLAFSTGRDAASTATAWDRLVRWRGLVREEVTARRAPRGAERDTAKLAAHAAWVASQQAYAQHVVNDNGTAGAADAIRSARIAAEEAERRWTRLAHGAGATTEEPSLARVLARLSSGEALVAFAEVGAGQPDAGLAAFVATSSTKPPVRVDLGNSGERRAEIAAWRAAIESSPALDPRGPAAAERAARRAGEAVRASVWAPLSRVLAGARMIHVVGDGPVADLPWLALPGAPGRYLADENVELHMLAAERELLRDAPAGGRGLLAIGDPAFGGDEAAPLLAAVRRPLVPCARTRPFALEPLPAAREEARELAAAWDAGDGALLLLGRDATEAAFAADAPGRRVIHIATHGVVVDDTCRASAPGTRGVGGVQPVANRATAAARPASAPRPAPKPAEIAQRVWLAFAGAGSDDPAAASTDDGLLTAEEVCTLDLRGVDWVVLSACHSGAGEWWPYESALGMRRAFHLAGARSVVASEWSVDDASTREWMRALYAARGAGATGASAAARAACRAVLEARRGDGRSAHPFYWAAFTVSGE